MFAWSTKVILFASSADICFDLFVFIYNLYLDKFSLYKITPADLKNVRND